MSKQVLQQLVREFPGLVLDQDKEGYELEVNGGDLVDTLSRLIQENESLYQELQEIASDYA